MDGVALPVRTEVRSSRVTETAFSIFSSASKRVSSITAAPGAAGCWWAYSGVLSTDQGADPLTSHRPGDVALGQQVEHDDRHIVVHAQAEGRGIRDFQPAFQDFPVR